MKKSKIINGDFLLKTSSSFLLLFNALACTEAIAADEPNSRGNVHPNLGRGARSAPYDQHRNLIAQADGSQPGSSITGEKIRAVVEITLRQRWQPIKGGPEGSAAMVEFAIGSAGQIEGQAVRQSAGNNDFDQACMEAIRKTAPLPALPPSLGVSQLRFGATFHAGKEPFLELKLLEGGTPPQGMQAGVPPQGTQAPPQGLQAPPQGMQADSLQASAGQLKGGSTIGQSGWTQPSSSASGSPGVAAANPGAARPPAAATKTPPKAGQKPVAGKPAGSPAQPPVSKPPQMAEQPLAVPDTSKDINRRVLDLNNLAVIAINDSNYESAITKLEEALKLDPTYKAARENLAIALNNYGMQLTNRPADALVVFHKAVALDPENPKTRTNLDTIIQYMHKNPKSFKDRLELGDKSLERGDIVGGRIEYEAALMIKPDPVAQQKLMQLMNGGPPPQMAPPNGRPVAQGGGPGPAHGGSTGGAKKPVTAGGGKPSGGEPSTGGGGGPASLDTLYRNVKSLEQKTFGKTFESDDILSRLSRLETKLLGKPQTGKPLRRLDALLLMQ